ncbi:hypothetical protein CU097_006491 [Rhizopus azygosporus]|uniref:C2H2-type domain-containing protein n=1 Tax=Rhizopus azygosporus TaxID=86630 RepID=A0A367J7C3_RHIAZ|nr:hypothetical protein CU097_006491 [Rhizopus azygosporus]
MPSTQDDTYCKACKKKFNNAATFKNHLNSAKHIANEKKFKSKPQQPKQQVKQTPIQEIEGLLQSPDLWSLFRALILCIEIDDIVRGRPIYSTLLNHRNYLDVRLLCDLYEERLWLKEQPYLKDDLAFIQLALSTDYKDEPILMYAQKEEGMLNRIQCLLKSSSSS